MNCFQVWEKLLGHYCILVFVFSWCEATSERSGYAHFRISYFLKLIPFVLQVLRSYGGLLYEIFTIGKLF